MPLVVTINNNRNTVSNAYSSPPPRLHVTLQSSIKKKKHSFIQSTLVSPSSFSSSSSSSSSSSVSSPSFTFPLLSIENDTMFDNSLLDSIGLRSKPLLHQQESIRWMIQLEQKNTFYRDRDASGGILGDDMGLGKTFSMLAVCMIRQVMNIYKIHQQPALKQQCPSLLMPTLIIVPKALFHQWQQEILKHTKLSTEKILMYHPSSSSYHEFPQPTTTSSSSSTFSLHEYRRQVETYLSQFMFVITTYEVCLSHWYIHSDSNKIKKRSRSTTYPNETLEDEELYDRGPLFYPRWNRIICDEAHRLRNACSKTTEAICQLRCNHRWALTGTIFNNNVSDIASLCFLLRLSPHHVVQWWKTSSKEDIQEFRKQYLLRRPEQILNLPTRHEHVIEIELNEEENQFYNHLVKNSEADYLSFRFATGSEKARLYSMLLVWLLRIRQACNDSYYLTRGRYITLPLAKKSHKRIPRNVHICNVCFTSNDQDHLNEDTYIPRTQQQQQQQQRQEDEDEDEEHKQEEEEEDDDELYETIPETLDETSQTTTTTTTTTFRRLFCGHSICLGCQSREQKKRKLLQQQQQQHHQEQHNLQQDIACSFCDYAENHSSKTKRMISHILSIHEENRRQQKPTKIIIYSQWSSYLDLLDSALHHTSLKYDRFDGDITSMKQRERILMNFQNPPSTYQSTEVLLINIHAGGVGLNLTSANTVIMMDAWFNYSTEIQAIKRCHRIGQTQEVQVYRYMANRLVEKKVKELQMQKQRASEYFIDGISHQNISGLDYAQIGGVFESLIDENKEYQKKNRSKSIKKADIQREQEEKQEQKQQDELKEQEQKHTTISTRKRKTIVIDDHEEDTFYEYES